MDKISVGDRVMLHDKHNSWIPTPRFPVKGGKFECAGTVEFIAYKATACIGWDNGARSMVNIKHLMHAGKEEKENIESIW